jgi:hypothetical protein
MNPHATHMTASQEQQEKYADEMALQAFLPHLAGGPVPTVYSLIRLVELSGDAAGLDVDTWADHAEGLRLPDEPTTAKRGSKERGRLSNAHVGRPAGFFYLRLSASEVDVRGRPVVRVGLLGGLVLFHPPSRISCTVLMRGLSGTCPLFAFSFQSSPCALNPTKTARPPATL